MKAFRTIVSVFVLVHVFCAAALADVLQGKVASLSPSGVNLAVYNDQGQPYPNLLSVDVADPAALKNIRTYDWVQTEIAQTRTGRWQAKSIKRIPTPQVSASGTPYAAVPQKNALSDLSSGLKKSLSTPQAQSAIRGSLLGAVTGALSAGASGGKAGKGALIGAGTGAAVGLLQFLFNAPAPQTITEPAPYTIQERPQHVSGTRTIRYYDKDGHLTHEEIR